MASLSSASSPLIGQLNASNGPDTPNDCVTDEGSYCQLEKPALRDLQIDHPARVIVGPERLVSAFLRGYMYCTVDGPLQFVAVSL